MSDQAQREAALHRRFGMLPESKATLSKFNDKQTDWYARCRVCGAQLEGTLAEIKGHKHGPAS